MIRRLGVAVSGTLALALLAVVTNLLTEAAVLPDSWSWTTDRTVVPVLFGVALLAAVVLTAVQAMPDTGNAPPDRPPDDSAMRALLRAEAAAAENFPYRLLGDHGRELAEVYVRQQITEAVGPTMPVGAALDQHRHLVVTGQAGSGKSTLAFRLTASLAAGLLEPDSSPGAPVPLRVSARAVAARLEQSFTEALAGAVTAEIGGFLDVALDAALLRMRWQGRRWLIIVDGLDEVVDNARRNEVLAVLRRHAEGEADLYRLLITTRPLPEQQMTVLSRLPDTGSYEIALFNREQRHAFAEAWFRTSADATAEEFLRQADRGGLSDLMAVPLLTTVAAVVFEDHPGRGLPHSRYELYERYFSLVYESRAIAARQGLAERLHPWPGGERMAEWIAAHRMDLVDRLADAALRDTELVPQALDWLREQGQRLDPEPPDWVAMVAAAATSTGLLSYVGTDLKFVHHTFAEHRNASRLAGTLPAAFDPEDGQWAYYLNRARAESGGEALAVLAHHCFQQGSAAELLDWLQSGEDANHLLAAQLLAEGVPAEARHFTRVAETLSFWIGRSARADGIEQLAASMLRLAGALPARPEIAEVLLRLAEDRRAGVTVRLPAAQALAAYGGEHLTAGALALSMIASDDKVAVAERLHAAETLIERGKARQAAGALRAILRTGYLTADHRQLAEQLFRTATPTEPMPQARGMPSWDDVSFGRSPRVPQARSTPSWDDVLFGRPARVPPAEQRPAGPAPLQIPGSPPQPPAPEPPAPVSPRRLPAIARLSVRVARHLELWEFDEAWLDRHGLRDRRPPPPSPTVPEPADDSPEHLLTEAAAQVREDRLPDHGQSLLHRVLDTDPPVAKPLLLRAARLLVLSADVVEVIRRLRSLIDADRLSLPETLHLLAPVAPRLDFFAAALFRDYVERSATFPDGPEPETIAEFVAQGPAFRETAAEHLTQLVDTGGEAFRRVHAYALLAEVAPEALDNARRMLAAAAAGSARTCINLANALIDARRASDAAEVLGLAAGPSFENCPDTWIAAVSLLATASRGDRGRATDLLRRMATGAARADQRTAAGQALTTLGGTAREQGLSVLRTVAGDRSGVPADRLLAARALFRFGPEHSGLLADALRAALDAETGTIARLALARELAEVEPQYRRTAHRLANLVIGDDAQPLDVRQEALHTLSRLGPAARRAALDKAADLIRDRGLIIEERIELASVVSLWGLDFEHAVEDALEALSQETAGPDAIEVARSILEIGEGNEDRRIRILRRLNDAPADAGTGALAARELARDPAHHGEGIRRLTAVAANGAGPALAIAVLYETAALGHTDLAVAGLTGLALDRSQPAAVRDKAARLLLMLDPCRSPAAADALRSMTSDPTLVAGMSSWLTEAEEILAPAMDGRGDGPAPGSS